MINHIECRKNHESSSASLRPVSIPFAPRVATPFSPLPLFYADKRENVKLTATTPLGDFCNRRSIKCTRGEDQLGRCQNCADFDVACTFDRPAKRRGVKAGTRLNARESSVTTAMPESIPIPRVTLPDRASRSSASRSSTYPESGHRPSLTGDPWSSFNSGWSTAEGYDDDGALRNSWKAFAIASDRQIRNLVQVYFEIVYPM